MKLMYKGMKKNKFFLGSEKVPFGYEKKPVFENFPFHTLGYENFGCFFLMRWGGERDVGRVLPRINIGTNVFVNDGARLLCTLDGVCVIVYVKFSFVGAGMVLGGGFFTSFWDRIWTE